MFGVYLPPYELCGRVICGQHLLSCFSALWYSPSQCHQCTKKCLLLNTCSFPFYNLSLNSSARCEIFISCSYPVDDILCSYISLEQRPVMIWYDLVQDL